MALYEFQREDAYRFKNHVGGMAKEVGSELRFGLCPYCHGGHKKDKGTFSINLQTGQFECKRTSCSAKGNMITLSQDFDFQLSETVDRYFNRNNYNNKFKKPKKMTVQIKDNAIEYLKGRGISEAVARKYQITTTKSDDNVLVFPFLNEKEEVAFIKYRRTNFDKSKDKAKEWCESNCMPILFGMPQCEDFSTLVMTEGQIDSLSVAEAGIKNAVSVPTGANGFTWIPYCWDWVNKFEEIVVFGDCENGKITLADTIQKRFSKLKVRVVRKEDYKGCKDANEMLQKHGTASIEQAIYNAEVAPDEQIIDMADVEFINIEDKERMRTNIPEVDKLLHGLFFGSVVLVSGERGFGKSTFTSQLLCEAVEQDYNTFIYSGELDNANVKNWMYRQFAGTHVVGSKNSYGDTTYNISKQNISKINDWVRGKVKMKDYSSVSSNELCDVVELAERSIKKYGSRVILIDNLMTAIDDGGNEDELKAQSRFVGRLTDMAKLYNVLVILIAHPRKRPAGTIPSLANDEVAGSANITNKVDVIMYYTKDNVDEESETYDPRERVLVVTKNRLTGRLTSKKKPIKLYYNDASKRIAGKDMDFSKEYGWAKDEHGFHPIGDMDLPFV